MPADSSDQTVRRFSLVLISLATTTLELAIVEPGQSQWSCVARSLGLLVAPALATAWYLGVRTEDSTDGDVQHSRPCVVPPSRDSGIAEGKPPIPAGSILLLVGLFLLPFVGRILHRAWSGRWAMPEIVILAGLRNLGLGLGVFSYRLSCAKLAALISLFLVLVATTLGEGQLVAGLVIVYAMAATLWLMQLAWNESTPRLGAIGSKPLPWKAIACGLVLTAFGGVVAFDPNHTATVLAGLVPTSGGTDWNDPDARNGVNDGDNEVSGSENPQSVGFTESEVFLDTDRPSLYDTFNDMYGEPFKLKKIQRMVALSTDRVREQRERPVENLQAGREFPLVRRRSDQPVRHPTQRNAKALFYLKGQTPLHLRIAVYDRFDGRTWSESIPGSLELALSQDQGGWLRAAHKLIATDQGHRVHQIKVGQLDSEVIPAPAGLSRFRIGSVDRPDFFGWEEHGLLRMRGRTVPAGTVIELESQLVSHDRHARLKPSSLPVSTRQQDDSSNPCPVPPRTRVAELGKAWTGGRTRGWEQVEAIVEKLRAEYQLDRTVRPSSDAIDAEVDPVSDFLFRARRGADYQFASAAVLLIQSLGFHARLVSGFYADPQRYDVRTRHTPVIAADVHFWAEIQDSTGAWTTIEPSPGYQVLVASPSFLERFARALAAGGQWSREHWTLLIVCVLLVAGAVRYRREWLDGIATLAWCWDTNRASGRWILATLSLVEKRARLAGRPRPTGQTPSRWYGSLVGQRNGQTQDDLDRLLRLAERILHGPNTIEDSSWRSTNEVRFVCRRVVRDWTLGRFRALATNRSQ